jgi:hypothetical protein
MKSEELKPVFTLTYADLMQLGDKTERLIKRDSADLALYGVDNGTLNNIALLTKTFKEYPSDAELLGLVSEATKDKDEKRTVIHIQMSAIMIRVKNKFGISSATYKRFSTSELSNLSDEEMVHTARRVVRLATEYLPALSEKGLTQDIIDTLSTDTVIFDNSIDAKASAVEIRDRSTQERVTIANNLYTAISEIFDYGKEHYYTRDEAKYNDYLIYEYSTDSSSTKRSAKLDATNNSNFDTTNDTEYTVTP